MRATANRILDDDEQEQLIKAGQPSFDALKGVGILGKQAVIQGVVKITAEEANVIARNLVKLNHNMSKARLDKFMQGKTTLKPTKLRLNGRVSWDQSIPTNAATDIQQAVPITDGYLQHTASNANVQQLQQVQFFKCPKCDKCEERGQNLFHQNDLDKTHRCFHCNKQTSVKDWVCPCGCKWYCCCFHRNDNEPIAHKRGRKQKREPQKPGISRNLKLKAEDKTAVQDWQEMGDAHKRKIADQDTYISLGNCTALVKRICLGPILSKRFPMGGKNEGASVQATVPVPINLPPK